MRVAAYPPNGVCLNKYNYIVKNKRVARLLLQVIFRVRGCTPCRLYPTDKKNLFEKNLSQRKSQNKEDDDMAGILLEQENRNYETPTIDVIEIATKDVVCASLTPDQSGKEGGAAGDGWL